MFWDEGWTLMVARTWVERGVYGRLLDGQPVAPRLAAPFPVVASVAASFRLFGVGVWQGRLVVVTYTIAALLLLYFLARRLYDRRTATVTLALALFVIPSLPELHPLHLGRMVMAEMPMLFFLLLGYVLFLLSLQASLWFMPLSMLCWGIGLITKQQPLPFWTASLLIPLLIALLGRRWREGRLLLTSLIGSLAAMQLLPRLWSPWLVRGVASGMPITPGLISTSAVVLLLHIRLAAVRFALVVGAWAVLGIAYALGTMATGLRDDSSSIELVRWALLTLSGTWLAWYVFFSIGWHRYLMPPLFLSSVFFAQLLHDWTAGFDWRGTIKRAAGTLRARSFRGPGLRALLAIVLIAWIVPSSVFLSVVSGLPRVDTSVQQLAAYLNAHSLPDALIEGYTSELFFLLDRPYHYPPDEVNVRLIEAMAAGRPLPIDYDPLSADPDYLVINRDFPAWILYDEVARSDAFRLVRTYGSYELYERLR
jgi:hypothetical protein